MNAPKTVCFVSAMPGVGGPGKSLLELAPLLHDRHVVLIAPRGALHDRLRAIRPDAELISVPDVRRVRALAFLAIAFKLMLRIVGRGRGLVVHANGLVEWVLASPAYLLGVPVVVWVHNYEAPKAIARFRALLARMGRRTTWTAVSAHAADVASEIRIAEADRVRLVPNPIVPSNGAGVRAGSTADVTDILTVGYLGTTRFYKGFHLLPDILGHLSGAPIRLLLFTGQRDHAQDDVIWERLRRFPSEQVEIVGRVDDVSQAYSRCDVVLCPSYQESFCRVAAEAMAAGVPVVASNLPPLVDLLGDEERGLLFRVGHAQEAATQIRRLLDPDLRARLGGRGRIFAERFHPEVTAAAFRQVYDDARAGQGRGRTRRARAPQRTSKGS